MLRFARTDALVLLQVGFHVAMPRGVAAVRADLVPVLLAATVRGPHACSGTGVPAFEVLLQMPRLGDETTVRALLRAVFH